MLPTITISKSLGTMAHEVDGLRAAANGCGKRTGRGRFQSKNVDESSRETSQHNIDGDAFEG
jgi:hypothetical protein